MAAGVIPDPCLDRNEADLLWLGRTPWRWSTTLPEFAALADDERLELVCEGIDTVATLRVGGRVLGEVEDMHREHRFSLAGARPGDELVVDIAAGLPEAERRSEELGPRPHVEIHPFNALRKMSCSYRWDWGPETVSAGLWRPARLERWRGARLARVLLDAIPEPGGKGRVVARVDVARADDRPLTLDVALGGQRATASLAAGSSATQVELAVNGVEPWWPVGHGDQRLYDVTVVLRDDQDELERSDHRVGFRTVRLDYPVDPEGTGIVLRVNDRPIMVHGVNWIPDDIFPHRVTPERLRRRLGQAVAAHANLIRVWGGGLYASDELLAVCDELGVLVWHDLLMGCAMYSEAAPLRDQILPEVRENVGRIANHPCLAVVCGCNENLWAHVDWNWSEDLGDQTWGAAYYYDWFPAIVAELAPRVPYVPGSPFSPPHEPTADDRGPNDSRWGTVHYWEQWNTRRAVTYRELRPRFVSEFGWQAPPTYATLRAAIHDDPLRPDSPGMLAHQKAGDGMSKLRRGLEGVTGVPDDFDRWLWAAHLTQADAVRTGVEWFRSLQPHCTGTIWWQLNDCWPVTSWALVDSGERLKPAWYALRRAYRPRLVTIQPTADGLEVVALNDTREPWLATVRVRAVRVDGTGLAAQEFDLDVPAGGEQRAPLPAELTGAGPDRVVVADTDDQRATWWFVPVQEQALPSQQAEVTVTSLGDAVAVDVTATALLAEAMLTVDRVAPDAECDSALVTLLPGERHRFLVTGPVPDPAALAGTLVSSNQLVAG